MKLAQAEIRQKSPRPISHVTARHVSALKLQAATRSLRAGVTSLYTTPDALASQVQGHAHPMAVKCSVGLPARTVRLP